MRITICGSMFFARDMLDVSEKLKSIGHNPIVPLSTEVYLKKTVQKGDDVDLKRRLNVFSDHYNKIKKADAILVLNYDKNGIKGYIGANSFLEMGFAYVLNKKIFLLMEIPDQKYISDEVLALSPIVLKGDLNLIL